MLVRTQTGAYATDAICPHQKLPLDNARIRGDVIMCPHHGARFRLDTGEALTRQLGTEPLQIFHTELIGNEVRVFLPDDL